MAKIPPPPPIAANDPQLNRWLLELTSILNDSGGIDPSKIPGLDTIAAQVLALQILTASQANQIHTLQSQVLTLTTGIGSINNAIVSLGARAQVFEGAGAPAAGLGNVADWYANVGGAVGSRVYIKTGVGTWTPFPF